MVDAATVKTRGARRLAERRDRALSPRTGGWGSDEGEQAATEDAAEDNILDVPHFEVEEWS